MPDRLQWMHLSVTVTMTKLIAVTQVFLFGGNLIRNETVNTSFSLFLQQPCTVQHDNRQATLPSSWRSKRGFGSSSLMRDITHKNTCPHLSIRSLRTGHKKWESPHQRVKVAGRIGNDPLESSGRGVSSAVFLSNRNIFALRGHWYSISRGHHWQPFATQLLAFT